MKTTASIFLIACLGVAFAADMQQVPGAAPGTMVTTDLSAKLPDYPIFTTGATLTPTAFVPRSIAIGDWLKIYGEGTGRNEKQDFTELTMGTTTVFAPEVVIMVVDREPRVERLGTSDKWRITFPAPASR